MAEAKQEVGWDLSNNILASVRQSADQVCDQIVIAHGGRPRSHKPIDLNELNPFRRD